MLLYKIREKEEKDFEKLIKRYNLNPERFEVD